jgi:hypothetical protein
MLALPHPLAERLFGGAVKWILKYLFNIIQYR